MSKIDKQAAALAAFHKASRKGRPREPRPVTMPSQPTAWDNGADGPANQHGLRVEPATDIDPETGKETANPNGIKRRRRDNWVARYLRGDKITAKQAAAAETLRMASEGMRERDPLAALVVIRARGNHDPEAARVDARRYFRELWAKVPQDSRPVIERVVLDDLPIWSGGGIEARERHIQRLRDGLDAIS